MLVSFLVASCLAACGDEEQTVTERVNAQPPPTLEIMSVDNADGVAVRESGGSLPLSCDSRVTVHVGPVQTDSSGQESPGLLQNWVWSGPLGCADLLPCGFVQVTLFDASGEPLLMPGFLEEREASYRARLLDIVLDLNGVDVGSVARLEAVLIQANQNEPYEPEGEPIVASWDLELTLDSNCSTGMGGMGGMTASSSLDMEEMVNLGGLGGLGQTP
ncbi:MAG: hypothetical protein MK135_16065 [Polyangiaceae bacterium]|nr:hypothetical protein [Polyangiaceae bacterium]